MHHVMTMVSIIKGADLRTLQKFISVQRNRLWLCTPKSRSNQSSVTEVAEIAIVILVDGEKHPPKPLYFICYEL